MRLRMIFYLFVLLLFTGNFSGRPKPKRLNFLFILVDDLGPEQLGCYGSSNNTPNIDHLAEEGMRFRTAYTAPICSPSRVLLLTGRYGFRTGWLNFTGRPYSPTFTNPNYDLGSSEKTIAQVMKENGYRTGLAGRWLEYGNEHKQIPSAGFDEYQIWGIWGDKLPPGVKHTGAFEKKQVTSRYWNPCIIRDDKYIPTRPDDYAPNLMNQYCKDFLLRNRERPFMLFCPMILVHNPYAQVPDLKNPGHRKDGNLKELVEYTDYLTGRLVGYLDSLGLDKNTVVIFAGDNGTMGKGKGTPTEKGARVPFMVRYPGKIRAGTVSDELTDFSDIFPTLLDYAGIAMPKGITFDGKSLVPTLEGSKAEHRPWIYSYFQDAQVLRDKRWLFEDGHFFDCGNNRDGNYKEVTSSTEPEVIEARKKFDSILAKFVVK